MNCLAMLIAALVADCYPDPACPERRGDAIGCIYVAQDIYGYLCVWRHWNPMSHRFFTGWHQLFDYYASNTRKEG